MAMEFDLSDVHILGSRPQRRRPTTPIPLDEDDMIEPACILPPPRRLPAGTTPPPVTRRAR